MTPPRQREQITDIAVLKKDVVDIGRRVTKLEEDMEKREDSSEGFRKELSEHLVDDAKTAGELKTAIGGMEKSISAIQGKITILQWVLVLLVALGFIGSISSVANLARGPSATSGK